MISNFFLMLKRINISFSLKEKDYIIYDKTSSDEFSNLFNKQDVFDYKEWKPVGTKGQHTRAFPEKMVEDFLKVFPKAKIILDPFMGSGTVAKVSKKMKRNFIGFEIEPKFVQLSKKNLVT